MAESLKGKRLIFPTGKQAAFLERIDKQLTVKDISRMCHCSERTVRDWRREKFSMSLVAGRILSEKAGVPIPAKAKIRDAYATNAESSKKGMAAVIRKYGHIPRNEEFRKKQWDSWWGSIGKFAQNPLFVSKSVHKPLRNADLAEFFGIMMGDGGISTYQAVVTLHHIDDLEYATFVVSLIKKLFKLTPSVYHSPENSVNDIVVSRKALVDYLHELGLPIGNKVKQQVDIPLWIRQDQQLSIACLRGLIDTDGCVFTHRYIVKGTHYAYKKLSFTSASAPLRKSVCILLQELGFHPRVAGADVRLDRIEDVRRYVSLIGSHNPKHLRRYGNEVG